MPVLKRLYLTLGLMALLLAAGAVGAQDDTVRDPEALARGLLKFTGEILPPLPSPIYEVGDTEQFWVSKKSANTPTRITARLAAASPDIYLWAEEGLPYNPTDMQRLAGQLGLILSVLRIRSNYPEINAIPETRDEFDLYDKLALPDVDSDPHLYILFAADLSDTAAALFNPNDSIAADLIPGGFSNQHELILVNAGLVPGILISDPTYVGILARQFYQMLSYYNTPDQALWLRDALSWYMLEQIQQTQFAAADAAAFLETPNTPLMRLPTFSSTGQEFGAQQLFLRYFSQRFGPLVFADLFRLGGDGLNAFDAALARSAVTDLVTGEAVTARQVFADFVMANVINEFIGDGRYLHTAVPFDQGQFAALVPLRDQLNVDLPNQTVNQFGARYLAVANSTPARFGLVFEGEPATPRLPMPPGDNRFYWSGAGLNQTTTLTRPIDLRAVQQVTLTFDLWHSLADQWNYAYLQVSQDGGQTWDIVPTEDSRTANVHGLAYGPGYTGISNPERPRPFPYLGIALASDGITITEIVPDGPLARTEIQPGDTIAGYDGQPWPGRPNLLGWLGTHQAGETISLYVQRGDRFFDVDVTLGAHPTRVFTPDALWLPQTADLSAYAGSEILLRFSYISLPDRPDYGVAIDNIVIPAINFSDDAEGGIPGWTLNGWQQTNNQTKQQFLLQAATLNLDGSAEGASVRSLIGPGDDTTGGSWDFSLSQNQYIIFAFSGLNEDTDQPARFNLFLREITGNNQS